MNKYSAYPQPVPGGFRCMIRVCRDARPNPVMAPGDKPKVLDSEGEAWKEIAMHLLAFMNGREIRGEVFEGVSSHSAADATFPNLQPFVKQRGKQRLTQVERARA